MGDKNLDDKAPDSFAESDFDAFLFDEGDKASGSATQAGDNTAKRGEHEESGSRNSLSEFASWLVEQYKEKFSGGISKDAEFKKNGNDKKAERVSDESKTDSSSKKSSTKNAVDLNGLSKEIVNAAENVASFAVSPMMGIASIQRTLNSSEKKSTGAHFENLNVNNGQVEHVSTADATYRMSGTDGDGNPTYVKIANGSEKEQEFKGSIAIKDGKLQINDAESGKTQEYAPKPVKYESIALNDSGKVETLNTPERSYRLVGTDSNGHDQYLVTTAHDQEGRILNGTVKVNNGNVSIADHDSGVTHQYNETEQRGNSNSSNSSFYETTRQLTVAATHAVAGESAAKTVDEVFKDPSKLQQWYSEAAQKAQEQQKAQEAQRNNPSSESNKPAEAKPANTNPEVPAGEGKGRGGDGNPGEAKPNGPRPDGADAKKPDSENSPSKAPSDATTSGDKPGNTPDARNPLSTTEASRNNPLTPADAKPNSPQASPTDSTNNNLIGGQADRASNDAKPGQPASPASESLRPAPSAEHQSNNQTLSSFVPQGEFRPSNANYSPEIKPSIGSVNSLVSPGVHDASPSKPNGDSGIGSSKPGEGGALPSISQSFQNRSEAPAHSESPSVAKPEAKFGIDGLKPSVDNQHPVSAGGGGIDSRSDSSKPASNPSVPTFSSEQFARSSSSILNDAKSLSDLSSRTSNESKSIAGSQTNPTAIGDRGILPVQTKAQSQDAVRQSPEQASKTIALPGVASKDQAATINVSVNKLEGKVSETGSRVGEQSINKANAESTIRNGMPQQSNNALAQINNITGKNVQLDAAGKPISRADNQISGRVDVLGAIQAGAVRPGLVDLTNTRGIRGEMSGRAEAISISTGSKRGPEGRYMLAELTLAMVLAAGGIRRILPTDRLAKADSSNGTGGGDGRKQIERTLQGKMRDREPVSADSFKFSSGTFRLGRNQNDSAPGKDFSNQVIKSALMAASLQSGRRLWLAPDSAQTFMRAGRTEKVVVPNVARTEQQSVQISLGYGSAQLMPAMADGGTGRQFNLPGEQNKFDDFLREQQAIIGEAIAPIVEAASEFIEMNDPFLSFSDAFAAKKSRRLAKQANADSSTELLEKDATGGSDDNEEEPKTPLVLCRPTWLIGEGDTLIKIAEEHFSDPYIGWLIADLNKGNSQEHVMDGKRIVEFQSRQQITLPVWQDIVEFYGSMPAQARPENLVTIVSSTQLDRDVVNSVLGPIIGASSNAKTAVAGNAAETKQTVALK